MFAAFVALSLAAASADEPKLSEAAQKELKKLEGKWKTAKAVVNGKIKAVDEEFFKFKGRTIIITEGGDDTDIFEVVALDPSTSPKILDLKAVVDMGPLAKGTMYEAIYKLDPDELSLAIYFGEGKKRPEKFESEKDSKVVVVSLKREKK